MFIWNQCQNNTFKVGDDVIFGYVSKWLIFNGKFQKCDLNKNFQWSDGPEYISNMSHMIKIIILDGS